LFRNATTAENGHTAIESSKLPTKQLVTKTIQDKLQLAPAEVQGRFHALQSYLLALGDDVQLKTLKHYFAYRRLRNSACVEVHPHQEQIAMYLKVHPDFVMLEQGFTRDMRKMGHYGTGDLEVIAL
jgi:predicted transport protein